MVDEEGNTRQLEYWSIASPKPGVRVVRLLVRQILAVADERFVAAWNELVAQSGDGETLVINLAGVEVLGPQFFVALVFARRKLAHCGSEIVLCNVSPKIRQVFEVAERLRPKDRLRCVGTEAQAGRHETAREASCRPARRAANVDNLASTPATLPARSSPSSRRTPL